MDYKKAISEMYSLKEKKKTPPAPPEGDSRGQEVDEVNKIIQGIEDSVNEEFNLSERLVYDRHATKPQVSPRMIEMVKRQINGMKGYKLTKVYETKGTYRMVFESETEGVFEVSIRERG
tara:strand:+ start:126 stop:482 length:357 start_codon:yes stop_codon:yes gene_type:complete